MKKLLLIALLSVIGMSVSAVPAKREWRTFSQPDGTEVELMLVGDEHFHYYLTRDNVPVMEENGAYYYAKASGFAIISSGILAHEADKRTAYECRHMSSISEINSVPHQHGTIPKRIGEPGNTSYIGSKRGLVILVNFSNKKFEGYQEDNGDSLRQVYDEIANLPGYTNEWGAIGSVRDYFLDQSNGMFDITMDIVGPVNLEKAYTYYGSNSRATDFYAGEMIVECCQAVDSIVDFTEYDWDGDGIVEEVFVLYAGYGEATGGGSATIWPHMSSLNRQSKYNANIPEEFVLDGVQIDIYACSNELYRSGKPMGIGVICHEFSHCLGLPDLYDTSDSNNFGMGKWDLLCQGNFNGPNEIGWVPAGYTSYERNFAGWLDYTVLRNDTIVTDLRPINEDNPEAYIIYNENVPTEYYLLEIRNQTRWDQYIPGSGLLITHVDYDIDLWNNNKVNATGSNSGNDHERMTIFHSSNTISYGHDAYPYEGNDSLTDNSEPAAMLYNENLDGTFLMHKPITEIARDETTGEISFRFENRNNYDAVKEVCQKQGNGHVTVYSLDGKMVAGRMALSDVGKLPKGMYLLRGNDGNSHKILIE